MQNNSAPLVSVVIPCYNHEQFVQDSIQGVIDQTYQNIELIIIDDGSSDGSVAKIEEMIEKCQKRFTRFEFRHRPNKGLSATLNEALEWCQGKYYSPIASDDIMLPEKTKIQVSYLENHYDILALCGSAEVIDDNNNTIRKWIVKDISYNFDDILMHKHELLAPTAMIRLNVLRDFGGYKKEISIEDWYIWLKISQTGKIRNISSTLSLYRQHETNFSKRVEDMHNGRLQILRLFKNSKNYELALVNAKWLNCVEKINHENSKILTLSKFVFSNPKFIFLKLKNKVFA